MHVFFIILLVYKVTKAENRETKYIDLLPEKEKEDFLDKIARRILSEVQTKDDRARASVELSDDELNQHDEFVNQILKEETQNLRKQANDTNSPKTDTSSDITVLSKDRNENINNDDRYVDLTLRSDANRNKRENKRRVFTVYSPHKSTENDSENSEESDVQDIQVKNFNRKKYIEKHENKNETEISSQTKEKSEENEKIRQLKANLQENESTKKDSLEKENNKLLEIVVTRKSIDVKTNVEPTNAGASYSSKDNDNDKSVNHLDTIENTGVKTIVETSEATQNDSSRVIRSYAENLPADNEQSKSSEVNSENTAVNSASNGNAKVVNIDITPAAVTTTPPVDSEQSKSSEVNSENTAVNSATEGDAKIVNIDITPATVTTNPPVDSEQSKSSEVNSENTAVTSALEGDAKIVNIDLTPATVTTNPPVDNEQSKSSEVNSKNTAVTSASEGDAKVVNIEITPATVTTNPPVDNEQSRSSGVNSKTTAVESALKVDSKTINTKITHGTETTKVVNTGIASTAKNVDVEAKPIATRKTHDNNETNYSIIITEALTTTPPPINDSETNDKLKVTDSKNMEPKENNVKNEPVEQLEKNDSYAKNSNSMANETENAIRQNLLNSTNLKENHVNAQSAANNLKEYKVYEISADADPFVKKNLPETIFKKENLRNKEEPYQVPIYSYIPKNAFYNSHNIFGPNTDSDSENGSKDEDILVVKSNNPVKTKPTTKALTKEQPFHIPVHNYSPNNAFYNPYNYFGLNSEYDEIQGKEKNYVEYDDDSLSYATGQYDNEHDSNDKNYNDDDNEGEYNSFNDPNLRFRPGDIKRPKPNKNVPFRLNLPEAVHYPKLKDIIFNPNDYFDTYTGRKGLANLRCQRTGCVKEEQIENSTENSYQVPNSKLKIPNPQHKDNVSLIRQLLLEKKYFGFINPSNNTKVTSTIKLEENENEEKNRENKQGGRTNVKKQHDYPIDVLGKKKYYNKYVTKKEKPRSDKQNIAFDYYFGRIKSDDDIVRHIEKVYLPKQMAKDREEANFYIPLELDNYYNEINNEVKPATPKPLEKLKSKKIYKNINKNDPELIKTLINIFPDVDIANMLFKMEKTGKRKEQKNRNTNNDLDIYVTVLEDMIEEKNKGLLNYDWLRTTVDLQGSKAKIVDMIRAVQNNQEIHPLDLELLKYIVYLHSSAKKELEDRMKKKLRTLLLPRSKKKKGAIKESGLLNRVWLVRMMEKQIPDEDLEDFEEFLDDMQTAFYELHTAVKYIAIITPYKKQNWFDNLRQIHITVERKPLLEVILHLSTTRLLGLIEETVQNGLEDDFLAYLMTHKKEVERTKEEFVFVLKLLEELKHM